MMSFTIFTKSVSKILDSTLYIQDDNIIYIFQLSFITILYFNHFTCDNLSNAIRLLLPVFGLEGIQK